MIARQLAATATKACASASFVPQTCEMRVREVRPLAATVSSLSVLKPFHLS